MASSASAAGLLPEAPASRAIAWALAGFACFSTLDAIVKWLSAGMGVQEIGFFMALFAAAPIGVALWREGGLGALRTAVPGLVLLRGVFVTGASLCAWNAFARLPLADAYALIFTVPLWVTVLSVPVLGERIRWRRTTAVAVGFLGILVMLRPGEAALETGHLFAAGAALFAAAAMLSARVIGRRAGGGLQLTVLTLLLLVVTAPAVVAQPPHLDATTWVLLALAGTLAGVAQLAMLTALRHGSAALVSPFQYSQLLWATLYGALLFDHLPEPATLAGAGLVIGSGLYIMHRERRIRDADAT